MGKLVRDRIPEIIEAEGDTPDFRVLEEAADVYEVLLAVADHLGVNLDDVAKLADAKRAERGGFERRLWLEL